MTDIMEFEPKAIWKHFAEICKIPHGSKNEDAIIDYIDNFAKNLGLETARDDVNNIVVRKPASCGKENAPTVILQGHVDMVCEKNMDVEHDFLKDPIQLEKRDEYLYAKGTTLGADNGIGVAAAMAILESPDMVHGPLECLFTVDEETGLTGAQGIQPGYLAGKIMLNMDSEDYNTITVGCAGGGDSNFTFPLEKAAPAGQSALLVRLDGFRGGHSGVDIAEQRGNAVKLLNRALWKAGLSTNFVIADFMGGDKHNAIPRETQALVVVEDPETFKSLVGEEMVGIMGEFKPVEPCVNLSISDAQLPAEALSVDSTIGLVRLIQAIPHGVISYSYDIHGLVETSNNLASVRIDGDKALILTSTRSSVTSALDATRQRLVAIAAMAGSEIQLESAYPGWKPNLESPVLGVAKEVFTKHLGEEPTIEAIHAGLECGLIGERFPGMDMISIGPTIQNPHSPDERVKIDTVELFWVVVADILEKLAA